MKNSDKTIKRMKQTAKISGEIIKNAAVSKKINCIIEIREQIETSIQVTSDYYYNFFLRI
jgi:hypothetical protein